MNTSNPNVREVGGRSLAVVDTADTYGWDTVFGIRIADANAAIARAKSSPPCFTVSDPTDGVSVTGTFSDWRISIGGSGDLVRLAIPVASAAVNTMGQVDQLTNVTALVNVRLNFLHQVDPNGHACHQLRVRTFATVETEKVAAILEIDYPPNQHLSFMGRASFRALLELWLNKNLDDFDHVFATVDLNRSADEQAFQWMQPTDVSYAYTDLGASGDGVLGVLCMTGGRSSAGLIQQVSPLVIPPTQRAGFLISRHRVLEQLLLPVMPKLFKGSHSADFAVRGDGDAIINAHQNISFKVHPKGHKEYTAKIESLELKIDGGELQLNVLTRTEIIPGIHAYCRTQNFLKLKLINKSGGIQTLGYANSRKPITQHWTKAALAIMITEELLAVMAAVILVVAIIATDGAALALSGFIGALAGIIGLTKNLAEDIHHDKGPAIKGFLLNATASIQWADSKDFRLHYAAFDDSLRLGGDPGFAKSKGKTVLGQSAASSCGDEMDTDVAIVKTDQR